MKAIPGLDHQVTGDIGGCHSTCAAPDTTGSSAMNWSCISRSTPAGLACFGGVGTARTDEVAAP